MPNKRLLENPDFPPEYLDYTKWPTVLDDDFSAENKQKYRSRKKAVELYLDGDIQVKEIEKLTGICLKEIRRYIHRCFEKDERGVIWGYRALIPNKRTYSYVRKADTSSPDINLTGAFEQLLDRYPKIADKIKSLYLGKKKKKNEPVETKIKPKFIWKKFLDACRNEGIDVINEYPFNTADQAKRSLERYLKKLDCQYFEEAAKRHGDEAGRRAQSIGRSSPNHPTPLMPYQSVEFDGHRIDAICAIEFKTPTGETFIKHMIRLWLLVIIDVATRVILGWHISTGKEYSGVDVLACIRKALLPWEPRTFSITGLTYPENGGFPSGVIPKAKWATWQEFKIDNGKANLSKIVSERLNHLTGCAINPGPVNHPETRRFIERWFLTIEENGYHRLPSTTGSNPKDPRRENPEEKAVKFQISMQHLEELTEVFIAKYNGTRHEGLNYLSPLEVMRQRLETAIVPVVPEEIRNELTFLTFKAERTVLGSVRTGKRPYIYYEGVNYRNDVLAECPGLIGKKLKLLVNADDLRVIRAYLPDGSFLGYLSATGHWGISPHSLKTRQEINSLKNKKLIEFSIDDDPIEIFWNYITSQAVKNKSARNTAARLELEKSRSSESNVSNIGKKDNKVVFLEQERREKQKVLREGAFTRITKTITF